MLETSLISTINVLCPVKISSEAPIRVKYLSMIDKFAFLAGTKEPICAIIEISAICFMYVDLPDILGPVSTTKLSFSVKIVSFET